jgi:hypothetical protein
MIINETRYPFRELSTLTPFKTIDAGYHQRTGRRTGYLEP